MNLTINAPKLVSDTNSRHYLKWFVTAIDHDRSCNQVVHLSRVDGTFKFAANLQSFDEFYFDTKEEAELCIDRHVIDKTLAGVNIPKSTQVQSQPLF